MFRKLFSIFRKKKKEDNKFQPPTGEAVANVPSAGMAVGAGVGAAQPGEAISQTNPVPSGEPVNSPPVQPVAPEDPAPEQPEVPVETPTAPTPETAPEQQPGEEVEPPVVLPEEPSTPGETQPTEPVEQPPVEEDPTNPNNSTSSVL